MRHFFLPVTVCALAQCADREHAKAMRERIDGEVQKRWNRSAALVPRKTRYFTEMQTLFGHFKFIPRAGEGGIIGSASSVLVIHPGTRTSLLLFLFFFLIVVVVVVVAGAMCWQGACKGDAREDRRRGSEAVAQIGGTCAAKDSLLT